MTRNVVLRTHSDHAQNATMNARFIYRSNFHCGCEEPSDSDLLTVISLNGTDAWDGSYYPGDWNSFEIKSDAGVDICICGMTVTGTYYGVGGKRNSSAGKCVVLLI